MHTDITSPLNIMVNQIIGIDQSGTNELFTPARTRTLVRSAFDAAYVDVDRPIVWDTNRVWTGKMELLADVNPDFKMICCVRTITDILNSFELLYRRNIYQSASNVYGYDTNNIYARCDNLMRWDGVVGTALVNLKSALHSEFANHLFILEYDDFVADPKQGIKDIYEWMGMKPFKHRFTGLTNVDTSDCGHRVGLPGLHDVHAKIENIEHTMLLPNDLRSQYFGSEYWRT
jgi:sulfotransferase